MEEEQTPNEEEVVSKPEITKGHTKGKLVLMFMACYWRSFVVILAPFIYIPIMFVDSQHKREYQCMYCILILATYWISEALPPAITAMLPVVMFPALGFMDTEMACMCYFKETTMMFVGGLVIAIAIEYCGLHIRFALKSLLLIGCSHRRLSCGLFVVTTFISMWITNTAATAMMAPIITAILETLEEQGMCKFYIAPEPGAPSAVSKPSRTTLCYFLGVAYSATIGGTGTYVGTGTNLSARDQIEAFFPGTVPAFHSWMAAAVPPMILDTACLWVWMNFLFLGLFWTGGCDPEVKDFFQRKKEDRKELENAIRKVIQDKYEALGPIKWNEILTGLIFLFCVSLWLFRAPQVIPGWANRLVDQFYVEDPTMLKNETAKDKGAYMPKDATPAMFVDILLFVLPGTPLIFNFCNPKAKTLADKTGPALINWDAIQKKMPWGLIFVIGGGFTVAEASGASGMSKLVGGYLAALKDIDEFWIVFICCLMATNVTELTSNVAVLNILGPVIGSMGQELKMNGPYLFAPVAICCSFSFMLPVGTPPNAVVAGMVNIPTKDMIIAGVGPTIFTLIFTTISLHFLSKLVF